MILRNPSHTASRDRARAGWINLTAAQEPRRATGARDAGRSLPALSGASVADAAFRNLRFQFWLASELSGVPAATAGDVQPMPGPQLPSAAVRGSRVT